MNHEGDCRTSPATPGLLKIDKTRAETRQIIACLYSYRLSGQLQTYKAAHIVSSKKFLRTSSSPHKTLPNDKYDSPKEVWGER